MIVEDKKQFLKNLRQVVIFIEKSKKIRFKFDENEEYLIYNKNDSPQKIGFYEAIDRLKGRIKKAFNDEIDFLLKSEDPVEKVSREDLIDMDED